MLNIGVARRCISPAVGSELAGYVARQGTAKDIHDHLYVRSLVIESDSAAVALVSADVLALAGDFVDRVRAAIEKSVGLPAGQVLIAATHTHSGPVTLKGFFNQGQEIDQGYMKLLAERIEQSVTEAWRKKFPARLGISRGRVNGIGVNRRTPDHKPVDDEVGVLKAEDERHAIRAIVVNYACHPTVLGPDNVSVTADFPGFALQAIERDIGGSSLALFLNGAQGDISIGHSSDLSAIGINAPNRTFEKAEELGQRLARVVIQSLRQIEASSELVLAARSMKVGLPLKSYPPPSQTEVELKGAEARLAKLEQEVEALNRESKTVPASLQQAVIEAKKARLYAMITHYYAEQSATGPPPTLLEIELQAVRIGDAAFLAIPAEVFVEIGLEIKRRSPFPKTFVVGLANGYIGYIPTKRAYETGGYECVAARVAPNAEDTLIEASLELLHSLSESGR